MRQKGGSKRRKDDREWLLLTCPRHWPKKGLPPRSWSRDALPFGDAIPQGSCLQAEPDYHPRIQSAVCLDVGTTQLAWRKARWKVWAEPGAPKWQPLAWEERGLWMQRGSQAAQGASDPSLGWPKPHREETGPAGSGNGTREAIRTSEGPVKPQPHRMSPVPSSQSAG